MFCWVCNVWISVRKGLLAMVRVLYKGLRQISVHRLAITSFLRPVFLTQNVRVLPGVQARPVDGSRWEWSRWRNTDDAGAFI